MSTTKFNTETGWTDEFPQVEETFYWIRHKQNHADINVGLLRDGTLLLAEGGSMSRSPRRDFEFLPASPSDFEQLIRLRQWKESAMMLLSRYDSIAETFGGKLGSSKIDNLARGVERLRKAATLCAIPYEALLVDAESRKWIAPEVWTAIENAVTALREALAQRPTGEQS